MPAVRVLRTHAAGIRTTHWLNAVLLAGMWWSGLLIDWADAPTASSLVVGYELHPDVEDPGGPA